MSTESPLSDTESLILTFLTSFIHERRHHLEQSILGLKVSAVSPADISKSRAAEEWRVIARAAEAVSSAEAQAVLTLLQRWSEWLFGIPDYPRYQIPEMWKESEAGRLWWKAYVNALRHQETLIPIAEAARLLGVRVGNVCQYLRMGRLTTYPNPQGKTRQKARLVSRREVLQLLQEQR